MIIETEHLIIRDFLNKDAAGLLEYLSHPRVNCFVGDRLCSVESAWLIYPIRLRICYAMPCV